VYVSPSSVHFRSLDRFAERSTLQAASRAAAYDIGFVPSAAASETKPKFVYLLNADDFDSSTLPKDAFVVYQGHHGDVGAEYADVCLPGSAYTEKASTWVNTEGRSQMGRAAVNPPGASRDDWKVLRALSEVLGAPLPYDETVQIRDRMWDLAPSLVRYDVVEPPSEKIIHAGLGWLAKGGDKKGAAAVKGGKTGAFRKPIDNFYRTDPISRASVFFFLLSFKLIFL
jgi:NADH dehydrogenase (ubiquinone) Fe-S protein 1